MLRGAEVLLLDEPTAGLDWSVRRDVLDGPVHADLHGRVRLPPCPSLIARAACVARPQQGAAGRSSCRRRRRSSSRIASCVASAV